MRRCWRIPRGSEGTSGPDLLVEKRSTAGRKRSRAPHWAKRLCWTNGRRLRGGAKMAEEAGLPEVGAGGNRTGRSLVGYRGLGGGAKGGGLEPWRRG